MVIELEGESSVNRGMGKLPKSKYPFFKIFINIAQMDSES